MKIIEVTWLDSHMFIGWVDDEDIEKVRTAPIQAESVGYLLFATEDRIAIIQSLSPYQKDHILVIPRQAVLKIRWL